MSRRRISHVPIGELGAWNISIPSTSLRDISVEQRVPSILRASDLPNIYKLSDSTVIDAPVERCFQLSTSIEVVALTLGMRPVEGKMGGMILEGDQLLWRGWKFGLPQMHETLITAFRAPVFFQDTMGRGRFATFQHDHHFKQVEGGTLLEDEVRFSMPLGWAGAVVAALVMVPHIHGLMRRRFTLLKKLAEGDGWKNYVNP